MNAVKALGWTAALVLAAGAGYAGRIWLSGRTRVPEVWYCAATGEVRDELHGPTLKPDEKPFVKMDQPGGRYALVVLSPALSAGGGTGRSVSCPAFRSTGEVEEADGKRWERCRGEQQADPR